MSPDSPAASEWRNTDPARTSVVVVAAEVYAAGSAWSLDGPVRDALAFTRWFLDRGVPPERIRLLASPLPANTHLLDQSRLSLAVTPARRQHVHEVLFRQLTAERGDLLCVVWMGHGAVDIHGDKRLFHADASDEDRTNLAVDPTLASFRTDLIPSFQRQMWLIDACQRFADPQSLDRTLPLETPAAGLSVPGREQFVLFAAGPGQSAINRGSPRGGLFSREVLDLLQTPAPTPAGGSWLPDPHELTTTLNRRFTALREQGRTRQTPTYFWHRSPAGDVGQVLREPPSDPRQRAAGGPAATSAPPLRALTAFVEALLELPAMTEPAAREQVLGLLRLEVYASVRRHPAARTDTLDIVRTCLRYPGALEELVESVRFFANGSAAIEQVDAAAAELMNHAER
ncbi:effector-associated domain 2-containing protein [Wenjunlia tyrosinilytica]|uniref:Effector-associated domain-containing protein n=1 Tax=Wenjunlia tyrosinilytica TaxID=1544741 RepID=A0A917ZT63_9ACTN|nr:caspase family protein [Wenjunlia tyrosinilytica]GGO92375.1 hypothetical protein GCM10012280_42410 [Wenjunlia tyrosinilytica]